MRTPLDPFFQNVESFDSRIIVTPSLKWWGTWPLGPSTPWSLDPFL
jgi:hypothetical protein